MSRRNLILPWLLLGSLSQLGFSGLQQEVESDQLGFWLILFIAAVVLVVLLWWALRGSARSAQGYRPSAGHVEEPAAPGAPGVAAGVAEAEAVKMEAATGPGGRACCGSGDCRCGCACRAGRAGRSRRAGRGD